MNRDSTSFKNQDNKYVGSFDSDHYNLIDKREEFAKAYKAAGLPYLWDGFYDYTQYIWVPKWLMHLFVLGPYLPPFGTAADIKIIECMRAIYVDEGLKAKYMSLFALDPMYSFSDELFKDFPHLKGAYI